MYFVCLVCSTIDIRNRKENIHMLENCRVIEGSLSILLMEHTHDGELDDLEFPLLTEITGYLLLYRVFYLHSLGNLFPNLRIIRGNALIRDYAFVVFAMPHLKVSFTLSYSAYSIVALFDLIQTILYLCSVQEIGLKSLIKIERGSVWVENNPELCFVDTIDWTLITSGSNENIIKNNKALHKCPKCSTDMRPGNITNQTCWNQQHMQQSKLLCAMHVYFLHFYNAHFLVCQFRFS